ncbi:hypothetical protein JOQ06_012585, partial [Pogonophryne albipinna]
HKGVLGAIRDEVNERGKERKRRGRGAGIILTAPTLMFGPVTHHMCVCARKWRSESSSLCALMILSPILVSYYRSLHVSFSLQGPDALHGEAPPHHLLLSNTSVYSTSPLLSEVILLNKGAHAQHVKTRE